MQNIGSYLIIEIFFTLQCQIQSVQVKLENVRSMFENRQSCFKKLLDKHVRPVQLVAPRPENPPRSKSPLFSPKHGKVSSCYFQMIIIRMSNTTWETNRHLVWIIELYIIWLPGSPVFVQLPISVWGMGCGSLTLSTWAGWLWITVLLCWLHVHFPATTRAPMVSWVFNIFLNS